MADDMKVLSDSDASLLVALRNGDEQALKQVYRQNYPVVVNLVITNGGSLQEAKDIFQEALIIFYEKVQEDDFQLSSRIKTYIYSVGRNLWLRQLKRKKQLEEPLRDTDEFVDPDTGDALQKEAQYHAMHQALNAIGEPCGSILREFYLNGKNMEEISERFGYTNADNAKNQKYKCLQRLKKIFFGQMGEDSETHE